MMHRSHVTDAKRAAGRFTFAAQGIEPLYQQ
jgi:hypothetical protein